MSVKMMGLVWDCDMPRDLKFVLLAYADHADHEGKNVFPAIATIIQKTGYSERSVQRITHELVREGYLLDDGHGPNGTNKWAIGVPKLRGAKMTPVQSATRGGVQKTTKRGAEMTPELKDLKDLTVIKREPSLKAAPDGAPRSPSAQQLMFQALVDVSLMDPKINASRIGKAAAALVKAGYTPDQVTALYSRGGLWYSRDWRGQRGDPPTPEQIGQTIRAMMDPDYQDTPRQNGNGHHRETTFERNMRALAEIMSEQEAER